MLRQYAQDELEKDAVRTSRVKDARGAELPVPENLDPNELRAPRGTTEVIARRIMSQRNGSKR